MASRQRGAGSCRFTVAQGRHRLQLAFRRLKLMLPRGDAPASEQEAAGPLVDALEDLVLARRYMDLLLASDLVAGAVAGSARLSEADRTGAAHRQALLPSARAALPAADCEAAGDAVALTAMDCEAARDAELRCCGRAGAAHSPALLSTARATPAAADCEVAGDAGLRCCGRAGAAHSLVLAPMAHAELIEFVCETADDVRLSCCGRTGAARSLALAARRAASWDVCTTARFERAEGSEAAWRAA